MAYPGDRDGEHASERTRRCVSERAQPATHAWAATCGELIE
jgi:hypothetical protein